VNSSILCLCNVVYAINPYSNHNFLLCQIICLTLSIKSYNLFAYCLELKFTAVLHTSINVKSKATLANTSNYSNAQLYCLLVVSILTMHIAYIIQVYKCSNNRYSQITSEKLNTVPIRTHPHTMWILFQSV